MTPRHEAIVSLVPKARDENEFRVDVGADHGWVARQIDAFAVERLPHRRAGPGQWVIADGLSATSGTTCDVVNKVWNASTPATVTAINTPIIHTVR